MNGQELSGLTDDRELIRRIRCRDEAALALMMERYSARVYSTAIRVLRKPAEAQEVTQDVFLALWRSPERFDESRGPLVTWLVILSRSRALDLLRHLRSIAAREKELTPEVLNRPGAMLPATTYDRQILVEELLNRLPSRHAWLVEKVYFEGRALGEVAAIQGTPLGTVKGRARFALKKLRSELNFCGVTSQ